MGKSIGVHEILNNTYSTLNDLPSAKKAGRALCGEFEAAIGLPEIGFRMIVWGPSGNGKTTFVVKLCKALSELGRVYYNSTEQGEGRSIQKVLEQCQVRDCKPGSFVLGNKDTYAEMVEKIGKPRQKTRFVVIDSVQYMDITKKQYQELVDAFPHISFILISWEATNKEPLGVHARAIRYMVDIKTYVQKGVAVSASRFGATLPYRVMPWTDKTAEATPKNKVETGQLELLPNG